MKSRSIYGFFILLFAFMSVYSAVGAMAQNDETQKKIFWVDSYNKGYAWSDGIKRGIVKRLAAEQVEFMSFHMNTKACKSSACMEEAGRKAKEAIDLFQPDVLIASDDNAQKFLVVPYYRDSSLPVIFCGVNWDASSYGYPTKNITGMIEVDLVRETVTNMSRFAKGNRIGYISGDTVSDRKIIAWLNRNIFAQKMKGVRVKNFAEFKQRFVELQEKVDMLFIRNYAGIDGWEELAAKRFIAKNLKVPSATNNDFMSPYVVFTLGKISEEQGGYAADTAMEILGGMRPSDFPIVENKQARLTVNLDMARAANIVLPLSVLKMATLIGQKAYDRQQSAEELAGYDFSGRRVAWVDSYHKGYEWSDGIEKSIREIFFETGAELKVFRMNTKRENTEDAMRAAAKLVKDELDSFGPDVVIASDDNAQKYLIVPYYRGTSLPIVFCGVNWKADMYGYPAVNVTGMVEISPIEDLVAILKQFGHGDRIGYLTGDVATERKLVAIYNKEIFNGRMRTYLLRTRDEFEKTYIQAQQEVDILLFTNYAGISGWNADEAEQFVLKHTRIPTGSDNAFMGRFVACTLSKSPEEQGHYAATTALKILQGQSPDTFPITTNKENSLLVNLKLSRKVGITFPLSMLKRAQIVDNNGF